jgi:hypothetical protein
MQMKRLLALSLVAFAAHWPTSAVLADSLTLSGNSSISCTVLQESSSYVTILWDDELVRLDRREVQEIRKSPPQSALTISAAETGIPKYSDIIRALAKQSWAVDLQQIPATVIDVGSLRHIPYKSHRVASECEINVYGDPAHPACVEVGLLGKYLNHDLAKQRCIEFAASLMGDATRREIVLAMKREQDLIVSERLTFEITPPTATDAYGGWWISIYNESALEKMRARRDELEEITTEYRRPPESVAPALTPAAPAAKFDSWHPSDFQYARVPKSSSSNTSSGGRVYVRGYYRKDGTYVHPHTRSK